jgi:hypothetical protein
MALGYAGDFVRGTLRALHAFGPAEFRQVGAAFVIGAVTIHNGKKINRATHLLHKVTMPKKKSVPKKRAGEMTTEEIAQAVFHPKVLRHAKRHIQRLNAGPKKRKSKPRSTMNGE